MLRLLTTAAVLLLTTSAYAKSEASPMYTFYKGTYWQTYGMASNDAGNPMCGMFTSGKDRRFYVKWTPDKGMFVQVWKASWKFSSDKVSFGLEFVDDDKGGDKVSLTTDTGYTSVPKAGGGTSLNMWVKSQDMATLIKVFGDADRAVITFPNGNEPSWDVKMTGSRDAAKELMHCMTVVQDNMRPATSPVTPQVKTTKERPAKKNDNSI